MSARARLQRLVRVRRARRDGARIQRTRAEQAAERAEQALRESQQGLDAQARRFAADARSGAPAPLWRSAVAGLAGLSSAAGEARATSEEAGAKRDTARERLVEARRGLRAAERLAERQERRLRREQERAAQRRLDEMGLRRKSRLWRSGAWLLLALMLGAAGRGSAEPEAAPAPDHGVAVLLGEIRVRQAELDTRERELADREQRVSELEAAAKVRLDELEGLATAVEERIVGWEYANEDKAISRLAKIYGTMAPRTAASLLEQLELDLATRIVAKMKHKQSAALLPLFSQPRALAMSRNVAHPLGTGLQPQETTP